MSDDAADRKGIEPGRLQATRRDLLAVAGAIIASLGLPAGLARADIAAGEFRDLSVALTGYTPDDPSLVEPFREAFASEVDDLVRLYGILRDTPAGGWEKAISDAGLDGLAEALMTAWYTGIVESDGKQRVVTYLDAFVWYAVGYTKPPSRCAAEFGEWADRPPGDF